jgi:hypothetical protein
LLVLSPLPTEPFLAHPIKLAETLVDYLLSDQPDLQRLEFFLQPNQPSIAASKTWQTSVCPSAEINLWTKLVLPDSLLTALKHLSDRFRFVEQVDQSWGFAQENVTPGAIALLIGAPGTGKTMAARAIAQTLQTSLTVIDLAAIPASELPKLLHNFGDQAPPLLLLKSAQALFRQGSSVPESDCHLFFKQRRSDRTVTLLSIQRKQILPVQWRQRCQSILEFPLPDVPSRLRLWQQAFPKQVPLDPAIDWQQLAKWDLTGGEIQAIAREAAIIAVAMAAISLNMHHLMQAHQLHYSFLRK